jgi:UDP-glucuronate 4-epimerase
VTPSVLITGGAGFVASHLAPRLLERTNYPLVLLDNFNDYYHPQQKRENVAPFADNPRVVVAEGSFCDFQYCRTLFQRFRIEHVIHLGAYPGVPFSLRNPGVYVENNVAGTTALLEAAREFPVQRFLFASSSTVYGLGVEPPFREEGPLGVPASPYGATKRAGELMGQTYYRLHGVPFTALRLFNAYGPRLRPDLALTIFTEKILSGQPITLYGDGSVQRDFTHVGDICAGIEAALTAEEIAGEAINLGNHRPIEVRTLIQLIERYAGRAAQVVHAAPREGDMPWTCADTSKAQRLLGYAPRVSIEEGVAEFVQWAQRQRRPASGA